MRRRIGEYLVSRGILTENDVRKVLLHGRRRRLRFGEAGVDLGLLSRDILLRVFGESYAIDFFNLDPAFYPPNMVDLLEVEFLLGLGSLPLGFKTEFRFFRRCRSLNIGMLNPTRRESVAALENQVRSSLEVDKRHPVRIYLIVVDQFLEVLRSCFKLTPDDILKRGESRLDPILWQHLNSNEQAV